jgi:hypothetical protein
MIAKSHINKNRALRKALESASRDLPETQSFAEWVNIMDWMLSEMRLKRKACKGATPDEARKHLAEIMSHAAWLSVASSRLLNDILENLNG